MELPFLFLESLGTPEMILIALVALIVFGPRRLPQIGRTIGKYTAEFKRASRDFRDTFEREVQMAELEEKQAVTANLAVAETLNETSAVENTIGRNRAKRASTQNENTVAVTNDSIALPEIRAVSQADFTAQSASDSVSTPAAAHEEIESAPPRSKREWL